MSLGSRVLAVVAVSAVFWVRCTPIELDLCDITRSGGGDCSFENVTVTVPPGAVLQTTRVHITIPAVGAPVSARMFGSPASVTFDPPTTLALAAQIEIEYADITPLPRLPLATLELYRVANGAWVKADSTRNDTGTMTVSAETNAAGDFALLGRRAETVQAQSPTAQGATPGSPVASPPSVRVLDSAALALEGITVTFAVTAGGGSIQPATQVTNASGIAASTSWTTGPSPGTNTATATVPELPPVSFTATASSTTPVATSIASIAGDNQSAPAGTALPGPVAVIVRDQFSNPFQGAAVTFAVASGGGSITGANQSTGVNGLAVVGSWTLGPTPGTNTLTATSAGLSGSPVTFTATGTSPPVATSIAVFAGNNQTALVGTAVIIPPAVIVRDQFNNPFQGTAVTFAVASGGGSVTGASQTTGSNGVATVGSWTLGTTPGTNTLTATSAGLTGSPVTFTATGAVASTGLDWFSDFRNGTGFGSNALQDGTSSANFKWNDIFSPSNLITVIPSTGLSFPTANVLQVDGNDGSGGKVFAETKWPEPAVGQYVFYRMYVRNAMPAGMPSVPHHLVESHIGDIAWAWEVDISDATTWRLGWALGRVANFRDANYSVTLPKNATLRMEWRLLRDSPTTAIPELRVYDAAGALIATNNTFINGDNLTLNQRIAAGIKIDNIVTQTDINEDLRSIDAGQSGQGSTNWVLGNYVYFGGFATRVTSDANGWIGTYPVVGAEASPGPGTRPDAGRP